MGRDVTSSIAVGVRIYPEDLKRVAGWRVVDGNEEYTLGDQKLGDERAYLEALCRRLKATFSEDGSYYDPENVTVIIGPDFDEREKYEFGFFSSLEPEAKRIAQELRELGFEVDEPGIIPVSLEA